ncbi:hypothetical protein [uncultured Croceitalea sp.]|uniref:hypothetical protein n=1 Tax=uncultured Croceitalea sp. TaxID=1798908 RepID=UPI0033060C9A
MLRAKIRVKGLTALGSSEDVIKKLNALGHIQKVELDMKRRTIHFEYATFRDMDTVMCELRKMGLSVVQSRRRPMRNTNTLNSETSI